MIAKYFFTIKILNYILILSLKYKFLLSNFKLHLNYIIIYKLKCNLFLLCKKKKNTNNMKCNA